MTTTTSPVIEHEIGTHGELTLRIQTGDVTVTGTDEDIARIRDLDGQDLEERFVVERAPGRLAVRPRERVMLDFGFGRRNRQPARLAVDVPRTATVSLDTASGDLRVRGLHGEQRYRTASGEIHLAEASGAIGIDSVSGDIGIGAIGAVDLSGRLVSGDLAIRGGHLTSVAVGTTSGDVELLSALAGPGPFSIQSISGDATVLAGRVGLRIEARTVTGQVNADAAHGSESRPGHRSLVVGPGEATLSFRSISGDLRVVSDTLAGAATSQAAPVTPTPPPPPATPLPPPAPDQPPAGEPGPADQPDDPRLAILRDLESGVIDVATATDRLAALEDGRDA